MEITKELLQSKADAVKTNMDAFLRGYLSCLGDLLKDLETEKPEEKKEV
jgi:hypothetical protein